VLATVKKWNHGPAERALQIGSGGKAECVSRVAHSTAQSKPLGAAPENVAGNEPAFEARQLVLETRMPTHLTQLYAAESRKKFML